MAQVPLTGAGPAPAGARQPAGRSRRGGRLAVAACAVVIIAAGIIGGFTVAHVMHSPTSAGDRAGQGVSRPGSRASATPSTGSTPAALPAGYEWYALPAAAAATAAGFRMAVPAGWSMRRSGLVTYLRDPSAPGFMEIDLTPHTFAGEMSEARWLQAQTLRQGKFPGYRRIALRPVAVRGSAGALWMFSWLERGVGRVVAQDYLFDQPAGGGSQSYALYASAPVASWPQTAQALNEAFRTFQPLT